ncbi:MAG TPA: hypothetical protein VKQ32_04420 [Polyangia bacterium]|nr:hypothetical protein [Polyangia bacterium]
MAVELGGDARIGVAHDPLHRREVSAGHHEQRGCRVADVVEADRPNLPDRPELHLALGAPADLSVWRVLDVAAVFAPTRVPPAGENVRSSERPPEDLLELDPA